MSTSCTPTPQECPTTTLTAGAQLTVGFPATGQTERRFPITPEAASELTSAGCRLIMQEGAAASIQYGDSAYARAGVTIASRTEALGADLVVSLALPEPDDVAQMRRHSALLTLTNVFTPGGSLTKGAHASLQAILERSITIVALDLIEDHHGNHPFADILAEVDGRAAIAIAASLLANPQLGKGILLGGVPGILPCETAIIGSSHAARAAARAASGLGSIVRIFDNDTFALRHALHSLGPWAIGSVLHRRTVETAVHSADIIILAERLPAFHSEYRHTMKRGVVLIDLTGESCTDCPVCQASEPEPPSADRVFVNPGNAVPRTAAMAISNAIVGLFQTTRGFSGFTGALRLPPYISKAVLSYRGKIVNEDLATAAGARCTDLSLFISMS